MPLFRIPRLDRVVEIVTQDNKPSLVFHQWWDTVAKAIESAVNNIQEALEAAGIAQAAAETAQAAAEAAQTAAEDAQTAADNTNTTASVVNSGVDVNPLSGSDNGVNAQITIAAHNRLYPDGTSVAVDAGLISSLEYSTEYWVYYDDPTRAGGAVTYQETTTESVAAQAGNRHLVGKVTTPAAAGPATTGTYKRYPGYV